MSDSQTVTWTDQGLYSLRFDDIYFSKKDPIGEIDHVFIKGNDLQERFTLLKTTRPGDFAIGETGFGTGLNFLQVVKLWLAVAPKEARLSFYSVEKYPLAVHELVKAHQAFPELKEISSELVSQYPERFPGWHQILLLKGRVKLTLWFGEALEGLSEFQQPMDAWFLDGFAPSRNPDMWSLGLFQQMARLSHLSTTFATFTAAGFVRRGLQQVGFSVEKIKGFAHKKEMLVGRLQREVATKSKSPWFSLAGLKVNTDQNVIVVGAGLAGAAVAYVLAEKGYQVTVLEQEENVAEKASGNLAGILHPLVTADWNLRSQFYLLGLRASLKYFSPWVESEKVVGKLSGLLALDEALPQFCEEAFAESLSVCDVTKLCRQAVAKQSILFHSGGWVSPVSVVEACLSHPNIDLSTLTQVKQLNKVIEGWQLETNQGGFFSPNVVMATGAVPSAFKNWLAMPIRPVKGQVTHLRADQIKTMLPCAVTHRGYSVEDARLSDEFVAVTGASFEAPDMTERLSQKALAENIDYAKQAVPDWLKDDLGRLTGRVGFRPTTPDHLPIIGPVVDQSFAERRYYCQSSSAAPYTFPEQQYQPGLYVSNGHGARGLMSVFLAAEMIAACLSKEEIPLPLSLIKAVHSERFAIRNWRKGKLIKGMDDV